MRAKTYLALAALAGSAVVSVPTIADDDAGATDAGAASATAVAEGSAAPVEETIDPATLDGRLKKLFLDRGELTCLTIRPSDFGIANDEKKTPPPIDVEKIDAQAVYRALRTMKTEQDALMASADMNSAKAHMSAFDAAVRDYEKASKAGKDNTAASTIRLALRLLRENPSAQARTLLEQKVGSLKKQCKLADYHIIGEVRGYKREWLATGKLGYTVPELPSMVESMFADGAKNAENNKKALALAIEKKCLVLWSTYSRALSAADGIKASATSTEAKKHISKLETAMTEYETLRLRPCGRAAYSAIEKLEIKAEVSAGYAQMLESIYSQVSEPSIQKQLAPKLEAEKKMAETCEANVSKAKKKEAEQRMGPRGFRS